jgi:hypothetical protein
MADKKSRLIERARETVRTPKPPRLLDGSRKKGYRIVAVSLYLPEVEWIDRATRTLQQAGNAKANRSMVVREAILRLQAELGELTAAELLNNFTEHQARRTRAELDNRY